MRVLNVSSGWREAHRKNSNFPYSHHFISRQWKMIRCNRFYRSVAWNVLQWLSEALLNWPKERKLSLWSRVSTPAFLVKLFIQMVSLRSIQTLQSSRPPSMLLRTIHNRVWLQYSAMCGFLHRWQSPISNCRYWCQRERPLRFRGYWYHDYSKWP